MSAPKSPREVGIGMGRYDIRVGNDPLPRASEPLGPNPIHCFDKGHHRVIPRNLLNAPQNDANGFFIIMKGRRIPLQAAVDPSFAVRLPVGFVAVDLQYILQHFSTRYGRNIVKIKRKIEEHQRQFTVYLQQLRAGNDLGRPRRPKWNSLNLDTPTEFERFLHPLKSFYFQRLRMAFNRLIIDAEDDQNRYTVFTSMNTLALPDAGNTQDVAAGARWNAAAGALIAVRIDNFDNLVAPAAPQFPAPQAPYAPAPPAPPAAPAPAAPAGPAGPTPLEIDENMLEMCAMGRSTKWKGIFIYMTPWQLPIKVSNPFVSAQYRQAFFVAQQGFYDRYVDFKRVMDAKRLAHSARWRLYTNYRDELRSISMLGTNRYPVNPYAERPQVENFTQEWRHFAFGLKEEMKNYKFLPVDAMLALNPAPANLNFQNGPILNPYVDINNTVLNSARKMFLI